jgi:hypothetical protein
MGLVIPPELVELASAILEDQRASEREVRLAHWLLVSTLIAPVEG